MMARSRLQSIVGRTPRLPPSPPPRFPLSPSSTPPTFHEPSLPPVRDANGGWRCRGLARRSGALHLSESCHFRTNNSTPSSIRRNHLPAVCSTFHHPSNFILKTYVSSFWCTMLSFSWPPVSSPYPQQAPQTSPYVVDAPPPCVLGIPQTILSFGHYRLISLGSCLGKRVDVRQGVVFALPFPTSEVSEEHGVVNSL